jgi:hypothetical protein
VRYLKGRNAVLYRRVKNFLTELAATILSDGRAFQAEYALRRERVPLKLSFDLERVSVEEREVWRRSWESEYFRHGLRFLPNRRVRPSRRGWTLAVRG